MGNIVLGDTQNAVYSPHDKKYWDATSLETEINRTFDICHGCRMCFKYCTAFPSLFDFIDKKYNGEVTLLTNKEKDQVVSECYHCKMCYVNCPYTDKDNHHYDLNFPALMQRAVHVKAKKVGVRLKDKFLQNADFAGKLNTGFLSKLVNYTFASEFHRAIFERILGIHKKKLMPKFHKSSFGDYFKKYRKKNYPLTFTKNDHATQKVVLFSTCFVNYNNPEIGKDLLDVFKENNIEVIHPKQNCCGMPGINTGDLKWAVKKMKKNIDSLYPYAKEGLFILAINPTCSLTLKEEYLTFLPPDYTKKATLVSSHTKDVHEFLFTLKKSNQFNKNFKSTPKEVIYHIPCHIKAQNIGFRSRDVMKMIPETKISLVNDCCGHDGTWAMKKENFELSLQAGDKNFKEIEQNINKKPTSRVVTDCPLAAIQIKQGAYLKDMPEHPIQLLAKAYRKPNDGGFEHAISEV